MSVHNHKLFGFQPTLFERLLVSRTDNRDIYHWNINELKESVAHDIEELLNSRAIHLEDIKHYPHIKKSVLNFGILDFVGLSTANPEHRDQICQAIQDTIACQETRLSYVKVSMHMDSDHVGSLFLTIKGLLNLKPLQEPVAFDAVLNPSTQQYSIKPSSR